MRISDWSSDVCSSDLWSYASRVLSAEALVVALAEQLQQGHEDVQEVHIQRRGAEHRLLGLDLGRVAFVELRLDPLGIESGQAGEHQHGDRRDGELQAGRMTEHVPPAGNDQIEKESCRERVCHNVMI